MYVNLKTKPKNINKNGIKEIFFLIKAVIIRLGLAVMQSLGAIGRSIMALVFVVLFTGLIYPTIRDKDIILVASFFIGGGVAFMLGELVVKLIQAVGGCLTKAFDSLDVGVCRDHNMMRKENRKNFETYKRNHNNSPFCYITCLFYTIALILNYICRIAFIIAPYVCIIIAGFWLYKEYNTEGTPEYMIALLKNYKNIKDFDVWSQYLFYGVALIALIYLAFSIRKYFVDCSNEFAMAINCGKNENNPDDDMTYEEAYRKAGEEVKQEAEEARRKNEEAFKQAEEEKRRQEENRRKEEERRKAEEARRRAEEERKRKEDPFTNSAYFKGCYTKEKLENNKRKLATLFHPDAGGDPEAFKAMMKEYEYLKTKVQE